MAAATTISRHDAEHIPEILNGYGDWFSAMFIRLYNKADAYNRLLLASVYPDHAEAYEDWFHSRGFYAKQD